MAKLMIGDKKVTPAIVINGGDVNNQDKVLTINDNGSYSVTADAGYTGLGTVDVNVDVAGGESTYLGVTSRDIIGRIEGTILRKPNGTPRFNLEVPSEVTTLDANIFLHTFNDNTEINAIHMPSVQYTGYQSCMQMASGGGTLEEINIPNLNTVNVSGFSQAFSGRTINSVDMFSNIGFVEAYGFTSCFANCTIHNLNEIHFNNLEYIGASAFSYFFNNTYFDGRVDIYFPKMMYDSVSGDLNTDVFYGMLSGTNNEIVVHFNSEMEDVISRMQSYPDWGGANVSTVFDIGAKPCVFTSNKSLDDLYFNGKAIADSMIGLVGADKSNRYIAIADSWVLNVGNVVYEEGKESYTKDIIYTDSNVNTVVNTNVNCTMELFIDGVRLFNIGGVDSRTFMLDSSCGQVNAVLRCSADGYMRQDVDIVLGTANTYNVVLAQEISGIPYNDSYPFTDSVADGRMVNLLGDDKFIQNEEFAAVTNTNRHVDDSVCVGYMHFTGLDPNMQTNITVHAMVDSEASFDFGGIIAADIPLVVDVNTFRDHNFGSATVYGEVVNLSGEHLWEDHSVSIQSGITEFYLTFAYTKDSSSSSGQDVLAFSRINVFQGE